MMVVVGGLGTIHGAFFGSIFVGLLPQVIAIAKDHLPYSIGEFPGLEPGLFGIIMVLFIIFEPMGLYGRWVKMKLYFQIFPLYRKATFKRQKTYLKTERVQ
jgi:branched-chain amino acid transport system permease protein